VGDWIRWGLAKKGSGIDMKIMKIEAIPFRLPLRADVGAVKSSIWSMSKGRDPSIECREAPLPLKKGGREGFLAKAFPKAKGIQVRGTHETSIF
jgi:hypothetical protein